jgi:AraC family transcriptional regulator
MHHTEDDKKAGVYIRNVKEYIQENLFEDLSLKKMAELANYSPFHFQRIFKHYTGESPKQYVIRLRLEQIARNLRTFQNTTVSELSGKSGFSSLSTFSRAFKKYFGISAQEYRQLSEVEYRMFCKTNSKKC